MNISDERAKKLAILLDSYKQILGVLAQPPRPSNQMVIDLWAECQNLLETDGDGTPILREDK